MVFPLDTTDLKTDRADLETYPFTPGVGDKAELWQKIMAEVGEFRVAGPL